MFLSYTKITSLRAKGELENEIDLNQVTVVTYALEGSQEESRLCTAYYSTLRKYP